MNEFIYLIRPKREGFMDSMTSQESEVMARHFAYLKKLHEEKVLIMAGPCLDGAFGIVVLRAESMEAAKSLMEEDPSVKEGIMNSEIHPYKISLLGEK